jgi:hypothetical protein
MTLILLVSGKVSHDHTTHSTQNIELSSGTNDTA